MLTKEDKILITGGSGFIGTNSIELFEKKGYNVVNFDKAPPLKKSQEVYWTKGNIMNPEDLESAFEKYQPTIVIHLAARTDTLSDNIDDYIENTTGTKNVIEQIKKSETVKHLIVASTQYVYKSKNRPIPVKDDEYKPHTVYGETKRITEEYTRNSDLQCMWTIIRPCNVWGPWHLRFAGELWKMIAQGIYIHPTKKPVIRTYAYIKNLTYQLDKILNAEDNIVDKKTFYLGDVPVDSYIWLNEISNAFRGKDIKCMPKFLFWAAGVIGDFLRKVGLNFPMYSVRYRNMIEDYYTPTDTTIHLFGLRDSSYKNNVKETIDWIFEEGSEFIEFYKKFKK